ncbi:MAG: VCBS repeat-containing protein [Steroidobacteraceae bacterium]
MSRFSARRPTACLALILPLLVLSSCGGDNNGAIITVPNSVIVADLNGDGVVDVATVAAQIDETGLTQKPGLLGVVLNSKTTPGNFGLGNNYVTSPAPPSGLAVGDLSGTGTHDLVVANLNAGTLSVFKETSPTSGTYAAAVTITVPGNPNDVQIADINGDGLPDLIVADNTGKVEYLLQNPTSPGTFQAAVTLPPITNANIAAEGLTPRGISVAVGDLNGDGFPDIAVTSFDVNGNWGQVTIYFQDPSHAGTYLATPTNIVALGEPSQIRIADVNQDGVNDIVVSCQGFGSDANPEADPSSVPYFESAYGAMIILQNSASLGTFSSPIIYPSIPGAISLAIGDLNNDGLPDIAQTSLYQQGTGEIATLNQDPANPGTFLAGVSITGSGQPVSIAIGDLDHDGLPDLVVADSTSAVWFQNVTATPGSFVLGGQIGSFQQ